MMLQKYFKSIIRNAHANNLLFGLGKDFNICRKIPTCRKNSTNQS